MPAVAQAHVLKSPRRPRAGRGSVTSRNADLHASPVRSPATQSERMRTALAIIRERVESSGVKLLTLEEVNALMSEEDE